MLLLLVPLLPEGAAAAEAAPPTAGPIGRLDDLNWMARHEAKLLLEASSRPVHLVLLGDFNNGELRIEGVSVI